MGNSKTTARTQNQKTCGGLTFSERLALLTAFVHRYQTSLATEGGSVLSARVRLAIAHAARQALLSCEECRAKLPGRDVCLRAGTDIHDLLSGPHTVAPELAIALPNDNDALVITRFIHAVVNHQSRIDKAWFEATMHDIDHKTTIIPHSIIGDARKFFVHTLLCELVLVTVMAHSMFCFYLAIGQDPPALPKLPEATTTTSPCSTAEPYWFDWTKVVKGGTASRGLYYDGTGWAPYLPRFCIDTRSSEFDKIPGVAKDNLALFFSWRGIPSGPYVAVAYAVADLVWFQLWLNLSYVDQNRNMFLPFRPLDGTTHCSGSVTRSDLEIVATAVAEAHQCAF